MANLYSFNGKGQAELMAALYNNSNMDEMNMEQGQQYQQLKMNGPNFGIQEYQHVPSADNQYMDPNGFHNNNQGLDLRTIDPRLLQQIPIQNGYGGPVNPAAQPPYNSPNPGYGQQFQGNPGVLPYAQYSHIEHNSGTVNFQCSNQSPMMHVHGGRPHYQQPQQPQHPQHPRHQRLNVQQQNNIMSPPQVAHGLDQHHNNTLTASPRNEMDADYSDDSAGTLEEDKNPNNTENKKAGKGKSKTSAKDRRAVKSCDRCRVKKIRCEFKNQSGPCDECMVQIPKARARGEILKCCDNGKERGSNERERMAMRQHIARLHERNQNLQRVNDALQAENKQLRDSAQSSNLFLNNPNPPTPPENGQFRIQPRLAVNNINLNTDHPMGDYLMDGKYDYLNNANYNNNNNQNDDNGDPNMEEQLE